MSESCSSTFVSNKFALKKARNSQRTRIKCELNECEINAEEINSFEFDSSFISTQCKVFWHSLTVNRLTVIGSQFNRVYALFHFHSLSVCESDNFNCRYWKIGGNQIKWKTLRCFLLHFLIDSTNEGERWQNEEKRRKLKNEEPKNLNFFGWEQMYTQLIIKTQGQNASKQ